MYFSENLETCTIRWVLICEGGVGFGKSNIENAFFEFFLREVSTTPTPALPIYPRGGDPSQKRTRTACTSQAAGQAVPDARQATPRTGTHARTLDTLHRSALDTRQATPGRSYRRRALEEVQLLYHAYCDSSITSMVY